ncbi:MAG: DNA recombination protein RmuC [Clostridia bacterium]|nr:DNA recombination protein RmuC [Clostridia bacterium]
MVQFLNDHIAVMLLIACALLILCSALLFIVLRRQSKHTQSLQAASKQAENAIADHLSHTAALLENRLRDEMNRQEATILSAQAENARDIMQHIDALGQRFDTLSQTQEMRLHRMAATLDEKLTMNEARTEKLRESLAQSMQKLQTENAEKLEKMRQTVDEKLHETLNRRLGESFSLVNERLEQVYKGLGEMQTLASGVGDLKKVLTNVKTRGIWGEVQLGALLEQMLSVDQFAENVQVAPHAKERVEFAVILPGRDDSHSVYLPIDSKFPVEAYERLLSAVEGGDASLVTAASTELEQSIRTEAKRIAGKYIVPPYTTDFAVMFLPTEGLYAEALRCRGLMEELQQKHRILISGPSTLSALLSSLQLGFRTLAIEQRSAEVWQLLGAVKTEFSRFSDLLDQTQQRLRQAGDTIEKAASKTRAIHRRLRAVEALGTAQSAKLLNLPEEEAADSDNL